MINSLTDTQKTIIRILFVEKESSRSLLANKLSLTNAALTLTLKPLLENKIIKETKVESQKIGRKQLKLSLNKDYGYFLGIDIKKHHRNFYLMDMDGSSVVHDDLNDVSLREKIKPYQDHILAIGVTVRGQATIDHFKKMYPDIYQDILYINRPYYIFNNVDCLADIYHLYHMESKNFLLVKYGPGVGSSIYVNSKPMGNLSEFGHMYFKNDTIENTISYQAILHKDLEEIDATSLLLNSDENIKKILEVLSFGLINADALLSLQKIILSGALLSNENIKDKLIEELKKINPLFHIDKISLYPDYEIFNNKKSAINALKKYFESED